MNKCLLAITCLILSWQILSAQENQEFPLHGTLLTQKDSTPIDNAHIILYPSGKGTISNEKGNFMLFVQPGDSFLVSRLGYGRRVIKVPTRSSSNLYRMKIYLSPEPYRLPTIVIKSEKESNREIRIKLNKGKQPGPGNIEEGAQIEGPLTNLYNALKGEQWVRQETRDLLLKRKNQKYLLNSAYRLFITQDLGIPEKEIKKFLNFCQFSHDLTQANYYQIVKELKHCYRQYRRSKLNR